MSAGMSAARAAKIAKVGLATIAKARHSGTRLKRPWRHRSRARSHLARRAAPPISSVHAWERDQDDNQQQLALIPVVLTHPSDAGSAATSRCRSPERGHHRSAAARRCHLDQRSC
jgi:hypothetical protein